MKLKFGDFLIFLLIIITLIFTFQFPNKKEMLKVKIISPYKNFFLKLSENRKIKIKGAKGYLILQIKNNKVRVIYSTCPNKICVKSGWISKKGEVIACIPNRIIVKITGKFEKKRVDFITK